MGTQSEISTAQKCRCLKLPSMEPGASGQMPQFPLSVDSSERCFIQFIEVQAHQALVPHLLTFLWTLSPLHQPIPLLLFPLRSPPAPKSCLRMLFLNNQSRHLRKQISMNNSKVCPCNAHLQYCSSLSSEPAGSRMVRLLHGETGACLDLMCGEYWAGKRSVISEERILSEVVEIGMSVASA